MRVQIVDERLGLPIADIDVAVLPRCGERAVLRYANNVPGTPPATLTLEVLTIEHEVDDLVKPPPNPVPPKIIVRGLVR